ncbi:hypothetical protein [Geodermatophilus sp. URMC 65]
MQELAWFEDAGGNVLATLVLDTDGEYCAIILARDLMDRFRWVAATEFFETPEQALVDLFRRVTSLLPHLDEQRVHGDETGKTVDFFTPVVRGARLHPHFRRLSSGDEFSAAREIISAMMRWYEDIDGNFVEQFQTTGFDTRIWELYLFAALTEAGLKVERPTPSPDFLAKGIQGEFTLEATTINPTLGPDGRPAASARPSEDEDADAYVHHYLPIRYAGPLTTKLGKEYWTKPASSGKPLVFAIQDFHDTMSMRYSGSALPVYLYGYKHEAERGSSGSLTVRPQRVVAHHWGTKTVPSGFFSLPGAENVSAVVFNSGGTISKFNRMGVRAGFGSSNTVLVRRGTVADIDPNASEALPFVHIVSPGYPEAWIEGMDVYHNANAVHPLDPSMLPGAAHHRLLSDGRIETATPEWKPFESSTSTIVFSV